MLLYPFSKSLVDLNILFVTIVVPLVLRAQCSKFHTLKIIKRKEKLEFFGNCAKKSKPVLSESSILLKKMFNVMLGPSSTYDIEVLYDQSHHNGGKLEQT